MRIEILGMFKRGKKFMEISRKLGLPHSTVSKAIKRFNELGTSADRKGRGRKKTARTPQMIRTIKRKVQRGEDNKRKTLNPAWKWSLDIIVNRFWIAFFYHGPEDTSDDDTGAFSKMEPQAAKPKKFRIGSVTIFRISSPWTSARSVRVNGLRTRPTSIRSTTQSGGSSKQ